MSAPEETPQDAPRVGPDDDLVAERVKLWARLDEVNRQMADLARSRRQLTVTRTTLTGRLDEIAAELRGRAQARAALASREKDAP